MPQEVVWLSLGPGKRGVSCCPLFLALYFLLLRRGFLDPLGHGRFVPKFFQALGRNGPYLIQGRAGHGQEKRRSTSTHG